MSEHKTRKPGEYKGLEYRRTQRMPIRARWVKLVKITDKDHKWARRHGLEIKDKDQPADSGLNKKEK